MPWERALNNTAFPTHPTSFSSAYKSSFSITYLTRLLRYLYIKFRCGPPRENYAFLVVYRARILAVEMRKNVEVDIEVEFHKMRFFGNFGSDKCLIKNVAIRIFPGTVYRTICTRIRNRRIPHEIPFIWKGTTEYNEIHQWGIFLVSSSSENKYQVYRKVLSIYRMKQRKTFFYTLYYNICISHFLKSLRCRVEKLCFSDNFFVLELFSSQEIL